MNIQAFSHSIYNSLISVNEASTLVRLSGRLPKLINELSQVCTNHGLSETLTCYLVHRHNSISMGQRMACYRSTMKDGTKALATRSTNDEVDFVPVNFRLLTDRGVTSLQPLEFGSRELFGDAFQRVISSPSFLSEAAEVLAESGLSDLLGFALRTDDYFELTAGEVLLEEFSLASGVHENIVHKATVQEVDAVGRGSSIIVTSWSMDASGADAPDKKPNDKPGDTKPAGPYSGCITVCVDRSPGHAIEHQACDKYV